MIHGLRENPSEEYSQTNHEALYSGQSLKVSLWAKLHLFIEMREQKGKIQNSKKRNTQ